MQTHSILPSKADAEIAQESSERLRALLGADPAPSLLVSDAHGDEAIKLPASAGDMLLEALEGIASGSSVAVIRKDTKLTTQQAADLLNVSRPFLVKLLESGTIPFHKVGTHRRVHSDAIMRYKNTTDAGRRRALDKLAADAQVLDMGY
ncbi:helix-turn-helix domain-containing protein [Candidatus Foliamicus sp.]